MGRQSTRLGPRVVIGGEAIEMPLIVSIGFNALRSPIGLHPHTHEGFELTYLADGEVTWLVQDGRRLHLAGGEMAVTQPGAMHRGEWNIIRPCTLFWIIFTPQRAEAPLNTPFNRAFLNRMFDVLRRAGNAVAPAGVELPALFGRLHAAMRTQAAGGADDFLLPRLRAILAQILTEAGAVFAGSPAAHRPAPSVERAMAHIERQFRDPISVRDIARAGGLSESRLHALFKAQTGQTPADYLRRTRCAHARQALLDSQATITDIALDHGFSSSQYFAHSFKKYTGMTPSAFRRQEGQRPAPG